MLMLFLVVLSGFIQACAPGPAPRQNVFDASEYAPYDHPGNASISGQISASGEEGFVMSGGGCSHVYLDPATTYSREWVQRVILKGEKLTPPDSRAMSYRRTTEPDGSGHFRFERLASGSYYVACQVVYERWIMTGTRPTMFEETMWVHGHVTLGAGEQGRVVLRR